MLVRFCVSMLQGRTAAPPALMAACHLHIFLAMQARSSGVLWESTLLSLT